MTALEKRATEPRVGDSFTLCRQKIRVIGVRAGWVSYSNNLPEFQYLSLSKRSFRRYALKGLRLGAIFKPANMKGQK